ncbi:hypothetical protein HanIR_Chr07g0329691 [Helianthus annuus]|nr:hypothetical protein HanIR_Chr07g0329691 [Helianthus annuus]
MVTIHVIIRHLMTNYVKYRSGRTRIHTKRHVGLQVKSKQNHMKSWNTTIHVTELIRNVPYRPYTS